MLTSRGQNVDGYHPSRRRRLSALVAVTAVCGVLSVLAADALTSQDPPEPSALGNRLVVTNVQPDQAAGFAVFDRVRSAADSVPDEVVRQVGNSTRTGRNLGLSRAIETPHGRGWAVPGNGHVCLVMPDPVDGYGISCSATAHALAHGLVGLLISSDRPSVAAVTMLIPRGSSAEATYADGRVERLRANGDGVVSTRLLDARALTLRTSSGSARTELPVPPPRAPTPPGE